MHRYGGYGADMILGKAVRVIFIYFPKMCLQGNKNHEICLIDLSSVIWYLNWSTID